MTLPKHPRSPIAIVGVSALFPGSLDATGFWRDILQGSDLMTDVPPSHWLIEDYYHPDPSVPDKTYAKRGAFLDHVPFDAMGWGVPPSIVPETDTSQLLALIVANQVLEDACTAGGALDRSRTSVILGVTSGQELLGSMVSRLQRPIWLKSLRDSGIPEPQAEAICERIASHYTQWNESTFPGLLGNVVAGRIANRLDLGGTNCVSDAACASSFSALAMAMSELQLGDSDTVITGGVDTMNDIFMFMCFSKTPALSPSGDCRPFSDRADGTMLGEGLAMVALERLEDAERKGRRIYAVIHGVGSSSDGRAKSVYAPVPQGQARALRRTYELAGYGPETVELVEAHGTGTKAGDAAEFEGLATAFGESGRADRQWCALGSVKSQIGHTKAAAGAAGLFKAVMALHHKALPPTIKVERPNPKLELERSPFHLATRSRPWVRGTSHPRRASVSSFGFGGSNFHVALGEYTGEKARRAPRLRSLDAELVLLSGPDGSTVAEAARRHAADAAKPGAAGYLAWLARTTQRAFDSTAAVRLALVTSERDLAARLLEAANRIAQAPEADFETPTGTLYRAAGNGDPGRVAFLFSGQGSQSLDMGAALALHFDRAREPWDEAADVEWTHEGTTQPPLHQVVFPPTAFDDGARAIQVARLSATEWAQPAIGCTSVSMLALLDRLGLAADCFAGHSFGEVTALHAAGVFGRADFLAASRRRGELMRDAARTPGGMTAVAATIERVREVLAAAPTEVVIANHNHPEQVVVSGPIPALEEIERRFAARKVDATRLPVATAFHSPLVAAAGAAFGDFLATLPLRAPEKPVYSNSTAGTSPTQADALRDQLAGQLARPVRFVEMIDAMYGDGVRTFVEVGPGAIQTGLVRAILGPRPHLAVSLDRKGQSGLAPFFKGLAALACGGCRLDYEALWDGYAEPRDPNERVQPKLTISLNGANYGKPYPPPAGVPAVKTALHRPSGSTAPAQSVPSSSATAAHNPSSAQNAQSSQMQGSTHLSTSTVSPTPTPAMPAPAVTSVVPAAPQAGPSSAPIPTMPTFAPVAGWPQAIQQIQHGTAEAHTQFLQLMAQSHTAFLETMERGLRFGLGVSSPTAQSTAAPFATLQIAARPALAVSEPAFVTTMPPSPPAVVVDPPVVVAPALASVPVAPRANAPSTAPASAAAPAIDLRALLLEVVSDKTGYPTEMLQLEMELEGDLGIDSIKRVEILSEMTDRAEGLPELETSELAALRTLGQVVEYLDAKLRQYGGAIGGTSAAGATHATVTTTVAAFSAPVIDLRALLLDVVSDKTGYPTEMLQLEMELEGDLGIDSIKRVEILSEMTDRAQGLPELETSELAALRTLGQVVEYLDAKLRQYGTHTAAGDAPSAMTASAPGVAATQAGTTTTASTPPRAALPSIDLHALLLEVVSDKTGYPTEMLQLEMELEGDLGIDSIKRVEILSEMTDRAQGLPELETSELAALRTLGQVVDYLERKLGVGAGSTGPALPGANENAGVASADPAASVPTRQNLGRLGRFAVVATERAPAGLALRGLYADGPVLVTPDGGDLQSVLVAELQRHGIDAVAADARLLETLLADPAPAGIRGIVFLGGLRAVADAEAALQVDREAFQIARAVAPALSRAAEGLFVTVQDTGGSFGLETPPPAERAWLAGCAGLARTAAVEWPRIGVKAIDLERDGRGSEVLARAIAAELVHGGHDLDVGLPADGRRLVLETRAESLGDSPSAGDAGREPIHLRDGDVVVASGGARGVTGATMVALAATAKLRFVLLGRTVPSDEPAAFHGIEGDAELKRALLGRAREAGISLTPAELSRQVSEIVGAREIRATLEAIRAAGSEARYVAADITDGASVERALTSVRAEWGAITALVHGAGVLADKLLTDKSLEQFERVFQPKVEGLRALLHATAADPLRVICLFSSVAARTGNRGQSDYAMANEVLNKVALAESARRGGSCVVKSLGWGPWEGGMVTPQLRERFASLGVPLIPIADGARMLVAELGARTNETVELVLGGDPSLQTMSGDGPADANEPRRLEMEVAVRDDSHGFLVDHSIGGTPVVPLAIAVEWLARAARAAAPGLVLAALEDVEVVRGIQLSGFPAEPARLVVAVAPVRSENPSAARAAGQTLELSIESPEGALHYRARAVLTPSHPAAPFAAPVAQGMALEPWGERPVYHDDGVLFHGPAFRVIERVCGISDRGLEIELSGVARASWQGAASLDAGWRTDPAALDGLLQAALLWHDHRVGGASLPTRVSAVRLFTDAPARGALRGRLSARKSDPLRSVFDSILVDAEGRCVAELVGLQVHARSRQPAISA